MVSGILNEIWRAYRDGGMEAIVCDENSLQQRGSLGFWFYIFYLSKFYEFFDTWILILRKKPVIFLHWFHHFTTAFLCWTGIVATQGVQWFIVSLNGSVHVIMYYYYLQSTVGKEPYWKRYITQIQMSQFVLDLIAICAWFYMRFGMERSCAGNVPTMVFTFSLLSSFLGLFAHFYIRSYLNAKKKTT